MLRHHLQGEISAHKEMNGHSWNSVTCTLERGWEMKNVTSVQHFCLANPNQLPNATYGLLSPPSHTFNSSQLYGEPVWLIYAPYRHLWVRYLLLTQFDIGTPALCGTGESLPSMGKLMLCCCCWVCSNIKPELEFCSFMIKNGGFMSDEWREVWASPLPWKHLKFPIQTSSHILDLLRLTVYYVSQ